MAHCFSILSTPGLTDEMAMIFLAIVDTSELSGRGGKADEDEDILVIPAPFEALLDAVDRARCRTPSWSARHIGSRATAAPMPSS